MLPRRRCPSDSSLGAMTAPQILLHLGAGPPLGFPPLLSLLRLPYPLSLLPPPFLSPYFRSSTLSLSLSRLLLAPLSGVTRDPPNCFPEALPPRPPVRADGWAGPRFLLHLLLFSFECFSFCFGGSRGIGRYPICLVMEIHMECT